jgi:hypothetical protein
MERRRKERQASFFWQSRDQVFIGARSAPKVSVNARLTDQKSASHCAFFPLRLCVKFFF